MTGGVNHKIFINYRRGDDPGFTTALYMHLEEKFGRSSLFMDVEGHIKPGDDFVEVLQSQVSQCEVLLVVIGPRWTDLLAARLGDVDDFVAVEIEAAVNQRKKVIPVLVGGAIFPRAAALPDRIRGLARKNAVDLRPGRFKTDCESLTAALNDAFASMRAEASASKQTERSAAEPASERHEMPRSIGSATPEGDPVVERRFGQIQDKKQAATLPLIGAGEVEASTAKT